jgi:PhnB protein
MRVIPYLNFNGDCAVAFKFYERCLGGKIESLQTHGDSPIAKEVPPTWRDRVLHARLIVGDTVLMASDSPPEHYQKPQGFSVSLQVDTPNEAERIFHELAQGGSVTFPIEKTFWAERFGMLVDRFNIPWMINCEATVQEPPRQRAQAAGKR